MCSTCTHRNLSTVSFRDMIDWIILEIKARTLKKSSPITLEKKRIWSPVEALRSVPRPIYPTFPLTTLQINDKTKYSGLRLLILTRVCFVNVIKTNFFKNISHCIVLITRDKAGPLPSFRMGKKLPFWTNLDNFGWALFFQKKKKVNSES